MVLLSSGSLVHEITGSISNFLLGLLPGKPTNSNFMQVEIHLIELKSGKRIFIELLYILK